MALLTDEDLEALRKDEYMERKTTPYDGQHMRRHDGVVHIVDGAPYGQASPAGWWNFYAKCHQKMKWKENDHRLDVWQNRFTDKPVTCLGCIAAP